MPQVKARSRRKRIVRATNRAQDLATSVYIPLSTDRREIRLLTLSPSQFQDRIYCSLSIFSSNECPPYEALSYVWGAGGSRRQIFVDGLPKRVTRNLQTALRHLRHVSQPRVLWIDAICINQRDIPERNTQVTHMGNVYRNAFRVIAWLGEEDEDSNLAYDALEALPADEQVHWDFQKNPALEKTFLEAKYITAVERLFSRSWWQRIWTVQEGILGPILYLVCGNRKISADVVHSLNNGYSKHVRSCCRQFFWKEDINLMNFSYTLHHLRMFCGNKNGHDLLTLLSTFRSRLCSDPRDKVYGLLGLCSADESNRILPDYSMPVSLVYEQVAFNIIEKTRSLKVLSQVTLHFLDGNELATANLPSWVPDWTLEITSAKLRSLQIRQERNDDYKASSGVFASIRYIKQGRIALKGIVLGQVAVLGTPNVSGSITKSTCNNWRDMARIEVLSDRLYNNTLTTYYDAFWQTLCCSILLPRTNLHDASQVIRTCNNTSYRSWYDSWWMWKSQFGGDDDNIDLVSSEYTGSEIRVFDANVEVSTNMRRLFISRDEEWLGLAPKNTIAGDVIALLEGGPVPYILRPSSKTQTGDYELIGDAYVHGIMDGESWKPDLLQEIVLV